MPASLDTVSADIYAIAKNKLFLVSAFGIDGKGIGGFKATLSRPGLPDIVVVTAHDGVGRAAVKLGNYTVAYDSPEGYTTPTGGQLVVDADRAVTFILEEDEDESSSGPSSESSSGPSSESSSGPSSESSSESSSGPSSGPSSGS